MFQFLTRRGKGGETIHGAPMCFTPTQSEMLARARADLRQGLVVMVSGLGLVAAVETIHEGRFAGLRKHGDVGLAITARRAQTLKARAYDVDLARVVLPDNATLDWVRAIADPVDDLRHPMKGPLATKREGDPGLDRVAIALCKSARLLPAALVLPMDETPDGVTEVAAEMVLTDFAHEIADVVSARVPLAVSQAGRVHVFRPEGSDDEHYAVEIGAPDRNAPVLARLHSACFTGDLLGSLKCDCGPQLRGALAQMGQEGAGVLLYLNQEGRGIGLANKMRAYALQDQGFDTVEANHRLGFEDDERDFRVGALILARMGFGAVRLMTNNPAKVARMEACGIEVVDRVPLKVGHTDENAAYLATKAAKSGHLL